MWPFDNGHTALWLALYLLTWALHFVFVGYVLVGTGYALVQSVRRADDSIAERARDLLPFMLGCGITAGVAPLLFLQLLYQEHFYTANLLLGPRWGAVVPALIVGFYSLYIAKAAAQLRWRRAALAVGTVCFTFVAWSWTEIHELMRDEAAWRDLYAAGDRLYAHASIPPRVLMWLGVMAALFASVAIWWETGSGRKRLAAIALAGHVVAGIAIAWLGGSVEDAAHGWLYLLVAATVANVAGWLWLWRSPDGAGPLVVAGATTAALLSGAVVREAPRLALIEKPRPAALEAGGFPVFVATAIFAVIAISYVWRTIRRAADD